MKSACAAQTEAASRTGVAMRNASSFAPIRERAVIHLQSAPNSTLSTGCTHLKSASAPGGCTHVRVHPTALDTLSSVQEKSALLTVHFTARAHCRSKCKSKRTRQELQCIATPVTHHLSYAARTWSEMRHSAGHRIQFTYMRRKKINQLTVICRISFVLEIN